jgi:hypothetical protein
LRGAIKPRLRIEQQFLPGLHVVLNDIRPHARLRRKPSPSGFGATSTAAADRALRQAKRHTANGTGDSIVRS